MSDPSPVLDPGEPTADFAAPPTVVPMDCEGDEVMPLLRDEGRPLFNDSWEAEAFAIGRILVDTGVVSRQEWMAVISDEIRKAQEAGDPDRGDTYYQHWMNALERVCLEHDLIDPETYPEHVRLWSLAVSNTPHGVAIAFQNAFDPPEAPAHEHFHDGHWHEPEPMAVFAGGMEDTPAPE